MYKCHKVVGAAFITGIIMPADARDIARGQMILETSVEGFEQIPVDAEYMAKHKPEIGGWFVVYEDGYQSFSPAAAFLSGYTSVTEPANTAEDAVAQATKQMLLDTINEQAAKIVELEQTIEELCNPPQEGFNGAGIGEQIADKNIEPTGSGSPSVEDKEPQGEPAPAQAAPAA